MLTTNRSFATAANLACVSMVMLLSCWFVLVAAVSLTSIDTSLVRAEERGGSTAEGEGEDSSLSSLSSSVFQVAAYLPDYRIDPIHHLEAASQCLTDLIVFSIAPRAPHNVPSDLSTPPGCCLTPEHYEKARHMREVLRRRGSIGGGTNHHLRLWATVGGGGRSNHFHQQPGKLTKSLRALALEQQLDGLDLDCEQFGSPQEYHKYMSWINMSVPYWKEGGLNVSLALHAGQHMMVDVYHAVDRIHLMTYDLPERTVGMYHADLSAVQNAVEGLMKSGCPPNKILLGIPAYARHMDNPGMVKTYAEIVDEMEQDGIPTQAWDTIDIWQGYQFDSPQAVLRKVELARSMKLGGVFFWELGQDKSHTIAPGGILLEAAARGKSYGAAASNVGKEEL